MLIYEASLFLGFTKNKAETAAIEEMPKYTIIGTCLGFTSAT